MTYETKLNEFWNSFGITAYASNNVPEDRVFPYMVYEPVYPSAYCDSTGVVNIYYYTESESVPNAKAKAVRDKVKGSGIQLPYDEGIVMIRIGEPQQLNLTDSVNPSIKMRQINLTYSLFTKEI